MVETEADKDRIIREQYDLICQREDEIRALQARVDRANRLVRLLCPACKTKMRAAE